MGIFDRFRKPEKPSRSRRLGHGKNLGGQKLVLRNYGNGGLFDAAISDRTTASWTRSPVAALTQVERSWMALCARSRETAINTDHGKRFLRLVRANVVGPGGISIVSTAERNGSPDMESRAAISQAWKEWGMSPEVTGIQTWRELQGLVVQTVARDGECFLRILRGPQFGKFQFQLQCIDPVRIPVQRREKLRNGNRIRAGIEFTSYGKPVAYYVRGDSDDMAGVDYAGASFERIPAEDIIHLFLPEMINQPRGLSWMGTALSRLHHLSKYETAAVINARIGASKMGFFETDPELMDPSSEDDEADELPLDAEPGTFEALPLGYKFREWNPQYPQGEFGEFFRSCLQSASAGLGVSYASLSNDLSGANYSSMRAGVLDEREQWMDLQRWFIDKAVRPVFEGWLRCALLAQVIRVKGHPLKVSRVNDFLLARYQGRRWSWVDPQKDVKASRESHGGLMRSVSGTIRDQGGDPDEVFAEIKEERERWEELGITPSSLKTSHLAQEDDDATEEAKANA